LKPGACVALQSGRFDSGEIIGKIIFGKIVWRASAKL
jgi:hypothetical protein